MSVLFFLGDPYDPIDAARVGERTHVFDSQSRAWVRISLRAERAEDILPRRRQIPVKDRHRHRRCCFFLGDLYDPIDAARVGERTYVFDSQSRAWVRISLRAERAEDILPRRRQIPVKDRHRHRRCCFFVSILRTRIETLYFFMVDMKRAIAHWHRAGKDRYPFFFWR